MRGRIHIAFIVVLVLTACRKDPSLDTVPGNEAFLLELPPGAPPMPVPAENPLTMASVRLGKALFFDPRLSRNGTISCASCHHPDKAFSDTVALSRGVDGLTGMRNAPSLANVGYHPSIFRDGGIADLERQVIAPVHDPVEMDHTLASAATAISGDARYQEWSMQAYGRRVDPFVITRAIASYERTLVSGWSRYDRYRYQSDATALSAAELRGWALFNDDRLNCTACHSGHDLSDHEFYNVGQYLHYVDPGRARITLTPADSGKFKVPSLRNIALTAPYMHDGAFTDLGQVIDHFASGGLPHANRSPQMPNFVLEPGEREDLIAFLHALTDERSIDQVP